MHQCHIQLSHPWFPPFDQTLSTNSGIPCTHVWSVQPTNQWLANSSTLRREYFYTIHASKIFPPLYQIRKLSRLQGGSNVGSLGPSPRHFFVLKLQHSELLQLQLQNIKVQQLVSSIEKSSVSFSTAALPQICMFMYKIVSSVGRSGCSCIGKSLVTLDAGLRR